MCAICVVLRLCGNSFATSSITPDSYPELLNGMTINRSDIADQLVTVTSILPSEGMLSCSVKRMKTQGLTWDYVRLYMWWPHGYYASWNTGNSQPIVACHYHQIKPANKFV